jgi:hypothetical protein
MEDRMSDDAAPAPQTHAASALTAFAGTEATLRDELKAARLDGREFGRRLKRCSLAQCRGTCCYDGVPVDADTEAVLVRLARERAADFAAIGATLPSEVIVDGEWRGAKSRKTAVRAFPMHALAEDFPGHFADTACVFLLDDSRCALQALAERDGLHRWYYKPITCWLHPIKIADGAVRLYDEASDPDRYPDYDGFASRTPCGRTMSGGCPAAEVLREELTYLGRILRRDLQSDPGRGGAASDAVD